MLFLRSGAKAETSWHQKVQVLPAPISFDELIEECGVFERLLRVYSEAQREEQSIVPSRHSFDPLQLRDQLANSALFDVGSPGQVKFLIVGDALRSHFNMNPVGRCYSDFVPENRRERALCAFQECVTHKCGMVVQTLQVFESGLMVPCRALGLPIAKHPESGTVDQLIFLDLTDDSKLKSLIKVKQFTYAHLVARQFIDIGYGAPTYYEDFLTVVPDNVAES